MVSLNNRIEVLPEAVVEKIAAGEVVERPVSVVKELVENSLDARADKIDIVIEDSGFSLIHVADNGCGMSPENIRQCVLRHATSKICDYDDLFRIASMGFRGEALASIGAISRLEIVSSDSNGGLAHDFAVTGGVAGNISPCMRPRGTTIRVRDLFFNTPARKKFMKSRKSERMALLRCIEQIVIPFPAIHFTLTMEGKPVIDAPAVPDIPARVAQIAGVEFARTLIRCTGSCGDGNVEIFVTPPHESRPRARFQNLYVNLRHVECDALTFAIRNAFSLFISAEFRPSFFCFLDIEPASLDINVHPAKQQIKFDDERKIAGCIHRIVESRLREVLAAGGDDGARGGEQPDFQESPGAAFTRRPDSERGRLHVNECGKQTLAMFVPTETNDTARDDVQTHLPLTASRDFFKKTIEPDGENTIQLFETEKHEYWDLIQCFQIHDIFICAPIKNGILLIDQHAAHERILFEQALSYLKGAMPESQQLLFPITVELSITEKSVIDSSIPYFRAFGYEIEDFGTTTVAVNAIPAYLKDSQVGDAIHEMVRSLLEERSVKEFPETDMRYAAAFACGCAIKAGERLSQEEMNALLNSLFATENPYTCPHGRPTLIRLSLAELRRRFLR